ncbi:DUF6238 family protein [Streptomyces sp. G1]|uniref:DUF6238 family protein n=1 Tax=Streptomyces sp. G1 TaxID=361572 RepID=UPI00202E66A0|nr:DUF6238 family protein [Streptomyces sp. G1]MCM1967969.1 DUF6238 family protein [Streptomyces sp. G1]
MPTESQADLAYATEALDFHRAITVPAGPVAASRAELDALHRHILALYTLFDVHTTRTRPVARTEADHLRAVRIRLWQAAEHLHAAFHSAPYPGTGHLPSREECRARLPQGAPELTICRRHLATAVLVRRAHTPAELRGPSTRL